MSFPSTNQQKHAEMQQQGAMISQPTAQEQKAERRITAYDGYEDGVRKMVESYQGQSKKKLFGFLPL